MFGRFVMPVTPALYLGCELLRRAWPGALPALALGLLATVGTVARRFPPELHDKGEISGIVEEPTYYPAHEVAHKRQCAEKLRRLVGDHESRIAIGGAQAMLAYYGKFDLVIECATGLTDAHLAHLEVKGGRARIGHEKNASLDPDYIVRRRVQFWIDTQHPPPAQPDHTFIDFGGFWGRIVTYDRALMRHLAAQEGVRFLDCEAYLDGILPGLAAMPRGRSWSRTTSAPTRIRRARSRSCVWAWCGGAGEPARRTLARGEPRARNRTWSAQRGGGAK
jgi:hypothetical protein